MKKSLRHFWLLLFGVLATLSAHQAQASHAIGSDMNYVNVGPGLYVVTYRFYRDCSGIPADTNGVQLNYSATGCLSGGTNPGNSVTLAKRGYIDGNPYCGRVLNMQQPCDPNGSVATTFPNYQIWEYSGLLNLGTGPTTQCTEWSLSVSISARPFIGNLVTEGNLYSVAKLNTRDVSDDSSPAFSIANGFKPLLFVCDSSTNHFGNPAADPDGDSMVFSLAPALNGPNSPEQYEPAYTPTAPVRVDATIPGGVPFTLDSTGTLSFTAGAEDSDHGNNDEKNKFVVVVQIDTWRRLPSGQRVKTGSVRRDILVVVFHCDGQTSPPFVPQEPTDSVVVNPGVDTTINVRAFDTINVDACNSTRIEFPIFDRASTNGLIDSIYADIDTSQLPGGAHLRIIRQTLRPGLTTAQAQLIWVPSDSTVGGVYPVTINLRDNGCPVPTRNTIRLVLRVIKNDYADVGLFTSNNNGQDDTLCIGQITRLVATTRRPATIGFPPRPAVYRYLWLQDADSSIIRTNNDTAIVQPRHTTRYQLEVVSPQGCIDTASILVIVDPANIATAIPDSICPGETALIQVSGRTRTVGPDGRPVTYTYRWVDSVAIKTNTPSTISNDSIPNPDVTPPDTRRYFATIFSSLGCTDTTSVVVFSKGAFPAFDTTQNAVQQYHFGQLLIYGQNNVPSLAATNDPTGTQFWYRIRGTENLDVFNDTTTATPTVIGLTRTTTYKLVARNPFGCESSRRFTIEVPLQIPNIITPNADFVNDVFVVEGLNAMELTIYNRWGAKIVEYKNYENDWYGKDLAAGTYYYLVRDKVTNKTYKGWVEIVK